MLRYRRLSQFVLLAAGVIMMAYGAVRGETALCTLAKRSNYVWSVWELDKKQIYFLKKTARLRGWIQAVATLLTNIHIPNFWKGKIYQGNTKTICVPGLNCYSCPAAAGSCPIGAFRLSSAHHGFSSLIISQDFFFTRCHTGTVFICGFPLSFWLVSGYTP